MFRASSTASPAEHPAAGASQCEQASRGARLTRSLWTKSARLLWRAVHARFQATGGARSSSTRPSRAIRPVTLGLTSERHRPLMAGWATVDVCDRCLSAEGAVWLLRCRRPRRSPAIPRPRRRRRTSTARAPAGPPSPAGSRQRSRSCPRRPSSPCLRSLRRLMALDRLALRPSLHASGLDGNRCEKGLRAGLVPRHGRPPNGPGRVGCCAHRSS
jgi:hypothetical protein